MPVTATSRRITIEKDGEGRVSAGDIRTGAYG